MTEETAQKPSSDARPDLPNRSGEIADLAARMARALGHIHNPEPKGWNDYHKYEFITHGQVTDMCRVALAKEGVAYFPSIVGAREERHGKTIRVVVKVEVTFVASESGQWCTTSWQGEAADKSDKAYNKAYTAAFKQALMKTFLIAGEVDPDEESPEVPSSNGQAQPAAPKKTSDDQSAEDWDRQNKRYWAITKPLGEKASDLREAFKRMVGVESSKDVPAGAFARFNKKLSEAEDLQKAADAMIATYPNDEPLRVDGPAGIDDDEIPF